MTIRPAVLYKKAPMLRLLLPLVAGIVCGFYLQVVPAWSIVFLLSGVALWVMPLKKTWHHRARWRLGFAFHIIFFAIGTLVVYINDIAHHPQRLAVHYTAGAKVLLTLEEAPLEKKASYKAVARAEALHDGQWKKLEGRVLIYFSKAIDPLQLPAGSQLVTSATLRPVRSAGNPGGFDFERFARFHGITHQGYVSEADFVLLPGNDLPLFRKALLLTRESIVQVLRKNITGEKEAALASALLIGYKEDLDRELVQAYTNTGVVHIIAISGLHLALIYGLLLWLTKSLNSKRWQWWRLVLVLAGLWSFSLLAGGGPSILRAAVMFTAIAISVVLERKAALFNTLALSAFALLCYNPFWLWDAGFQLSYLALLGLLLFYRPIYNLCCFSNKIIDHAWGLVAASTAAQLLTLPVCLYYFHQFPLLFLPANLVAVPLSMLILYGALLVCIASFLPQAALAAGMVVQGLIRLLNSVVERLDALPFATWNNLQLSVAQAVVLYIALCAAAGALFFRSRQASTYALAAAGVFLCLRSYSFFEAGQRQELVVYAIPKHRSIDIFDGRHVLYNGDRLDPDAPEYRFNLQPARMLYRSKPARDFTARSFTWNHKNVLLLDTPVNITPAATKIPLHLLVVSGKSTGPAPALFDAYAVHQVVADGTVPAWRAAAWRRHCADVNIPFHNVLENGAFRLQP